MSPTNRRARSPPRMRKDTERTPEEISPGPISKVCPQMTPMAADKYRSSRRVAETQRGTTDTQNENLPAKDAERRETSERTRFHRLESSACFSRLFACFAGYSFSASSRLGVRRRRLLLYF